MACLLAASAASFFLARAFRGEQFKKDLMKKIFVVAALSACVQPAMAVDITAGDWTLSVGGILFS